MINFKFLKKKIQKGENQKSDFLKFNLVFASIFLGVVLIKPSFLNAAACCGGSGGAAQIITNDDQFQFSLLHAYNQIHVSHVDFEGFWYKSQVKQINQTTQFNAAHIFAESFQWALSTSFIQKQYDDQKHSGLGDTQINVGYEFWPEIQYHVLKPRGFLYGGINIPTGYSKIDSEKSGIDARGLGLWGVQTGYFLTKSFLVWDVFFQNEFQHYFIQNFRQKDSLVQVSHDLSYKLNLGLGYNFDKYRVGMLLGYVNEGPFTQKNLDTEFESSGYREVYVNSAVSVSYQMNELNTLAISYMDQSLFGNPQNTTLGRTISLQYLLRELR